MQKLDPRIVKVSIEIEGELKVYENLAISAVGCKYANATQNDCEFKIANLDKETRNYLLTQTSPFNQNRTPKLIILEAGRQSYGTVEIFRGTITAAAPSQPPDITLSIRALTGNYLKGKIIARSEPPSAPLSLIAKDIAGDTDLTLIFQASEKNLTNYSFTGGALKQIENLGQAGDVNAYVDGNNLIVKDNNVPLKNKLKILNLSTGMIGIPEVNEQGVKVKFLLDNQTTLGGSIQITSELYPAINGLYEIFKLGFHITSRDVPFYWIAECKRPGQGKINKNQVIKKTAKNGK